MTDTNSLELVILTGRLPKIISSPVCKHQVAQSLNFTDLLELDEVSRLDAP